MKTTAAAIAESREFINRTFLNGVFGWMGFGFGLTALASYWFYSTPSLMESLATADGLTVRGYLTMLAPLAFVLVMSFGFRRLSYFTLVVLFLLYAAVMGVSLSFVFLVYGSRSVFDTFVVTSFMYGTMAVLGYTTGTNLTKMGNILLMALVGIIIASLVNMLMRNTIVSYVVSFAGVLVFCGLTAWDTQRLKMLAAQPVPDIRAKLSILGALTLYLDFINLFLLLLPFFGNRRK